MMRAFVVFMFLDMWNACDCALDQKLFVDSFVRRWHIYEGVMAAVASRARVHLKMLTPV